MSDIKLEATRPRDDEDDEDRKRKLRDDDSDSEDSYDRRKRRKKKHKAESTNKHKKERKRKPYSSDEESSNDEYSPQDNEDSDRRKHKKKKKKKRTKHTKSDRKIKSPSPPTFGKYGIVRPSDMNAKQQSFQAWLAEVKGIPSFTGPKWELQNYFAEYAEDYNTCTLPHKKYYDYDAWEMQEYNKQKEHQQSQMSSSNAMLADEAKHRADVHQRDQAKREAELQLLRATMNSEKIAGMKHQQELQAELRHAFKMGDKERVARIKQKLDPNER